MLFDMIPVDAASKFPILDLRIPVSRSGSVSFKVMVVIILFIPSNDDLVCALVAVSHSEISVSI